jgi:LysM repeat protein
MPSTSPISQRQSRVLVPVSSFHTVTPGQNLGHIATIHGLSINDLITANPGKIHGDAVYPGERLTIPNKTHPFRLG